MAFGRDVDGATFCSETADSGTFTWRFQADLPRGDLARDLVISMALVSPSIVVVIVTVEDVEQVKWTKT